MYCWPESATVKVSLSGHEKVETYVTNMGVNDKSTPVDLKHNFVLLPLVYNKVTLSRDLMEMDAPMTNGTTPIIGQFFSKFIDYNKLALSDVKKTYPDT